MRRIARVLGAVALTTACGHGTSVRTPATPEEAQAQALADNATHMGTLKAAAYVVTTYGRWTEANPDQQGTTTAEPATHRVLVVKAYGDFTPPVHMGAAMPGGYHVTVMVWVTDLTTGAGLSGSYFRGSSPDVTTADGTPHDPDGVTSMDLRALGAVYPLQVNGR
jgi:hypothetical protein